MTSPNKHDEATIDDLLRRMKQEGEEADSIRAEILERGASIIQDVIGESFSRTGFSNEDLFRPGYLGLLNAVYNFDLSHGRPFREYAGNLIKGEIRNHIRDHVKRATIPRWMRDLNRQIEAAEGRLLRELDRLPTLTELADAVNITEAGLAEIFKAREALSYVSLDAAQRENDPIPEIDLNQIRGKRATAFPIEARIKIASALERLADLQQVLLRGLFRPNGETA
jgi:DNA-directed RNA polymerase specialized sigma subunit